MHCGLCLNACPTYRELGLEMDSPRGRIYQMVQVATGAPITESYTEHIELCLACRGCERRAPPACNTAAWWRRRAPKSKRNRKRGRFARECARIRVRPPAAIARARFRWRARCSTSTASGLKGLVRGLGFD